MTAMQTTAVYACVRILSEAIASLPIHIYRYKDGGKEMVCDHPLYMPLHDEPNPDMILNRPYYTYTSMTEEEMLQRLEQSRESSKRGNYRNADDVISDIRGKYGL